MEILDDMGLSKIWYRFLF